MQIDEALKQELKQYILDRQKKQQQKVLIKAPFKLSSVEMDKLDLLFPFLKNAEIQTEVDESLLAGVVIEFGSKRIDLSLISELHKLKQLIYDIA